MEVLKPEIAVRHGCLRVLAGVEGSLGNQDIVAAMDGFSIVSALLALMLDLTGGGRTLILASGLLILAAELLNTAMKGTVDCNSGTHSPRAGKIKECGSPVVAVTAIAGGLAWLAFWWDSLFWAWCWGLFALPAQMHPIHQRGKQLIRKA